MAITEAHAGRQYPPTAPYVVSAAKVAEFAAALGEDDPRCTGPDAVAPPTFAAVLAARLDRRRPGTVRAAFGTTAPKPAAVLAGLAEPVAVVPLFLSPGLLLDPVVRLAAERGWTVAPPLGDLAAPLVLRRYARARAGAELR